MDTKVGFVDHTSQGKTIEELHEKVVYLLVVDVETLYFEVILFCHGAGLVVASEHVYTLRVLDFDRHEKGDHLKRLQTSVHVITQENDFLIDSRLIK